MEFSVLLGRFGNRNINRVVSELASIWTSVAFTLAAAAACVGLLRRLKIMALRRRSRMHKWGMISSSYSPHSVAPQSSSVDFPDADDVDDSSWSSDDSNADSEEDESYSDSEEEEEEEEERDSDSEEGDDWAQDGELAVVGRSASWTGEEVGWSGAVVKTWEGIGLELGSDRPAGKWVPLPLLFDLSCGGLDFSTAAVRVWKATAASQGPTAEAAAAGHYISCPSPPSSSSRRRGASVGRDWQSSW